MKPFPCPNNDSETIPADILLACLNQASGSLAQAEVIAEVSLGLKHNKQSAFCQLPFCTTVEAEAMGADIVPGDRYIQPRVGQHVYPSLESLIKRPPARLDTGRAEEVLKAIQILTQRGECTCLNLCGPFTVLNALIDSMSLYKAMRKEPEKLTTLLNTIEYELGHYALKAVEQGVRIISYSDPAGSVDILGPTHCQLFSLPSSVRLLKTITQQVEKHIVIHLCGKISTGLVLAGFALAQPITINPPTDYTHSLLQVLERNDICFIGHGCIKANKSSVHRLWQLTLNQPR